MSNFTSFELGKHNNDSDTSGTDDEDVGYAPGTWGRRSEGDGVI